MLFLNNVFLRKEWEAQQALKNSSVTSEEDEDVFLENEVQQEDKMNVSQKKGNCRLFHQITIQTRANFWRWISSKVLLSTLLYNCRFNLPPSSIHLYTTGCHRYWCLCFL